MYVYTPVSIHSLFSDLFKELWRRIVGGDRNYVVEIWEGFYWKNTRKEEEPSRKNIEDKNKEKTTVLFSSF